MDVLKFIKSMNLKKIFLLGHEVGGRVGMLLSLKYVRFNFKFSLNNIKFNKWSNIY